MAPMGDCGPGAVSTEVLQPAAQRPAVLARGSAVLDGLIATTMLTMDRLLPAGA